MKKTVKLSSVNEDDYFYYLDEKYKLSRFNGYYLGVRCNLTVRCFNCYDEVQVDCKSVRITDIKTGDRFSLGSSKVYFKTDMKYYGEYVCVDEKYEVTLLRETNNIYPID